MYFELFFNTDSDWPNFVGNAMHSTPSKTTYSEVNNILPLLLKSVISS